MNLSHIPAPLLIAVIISVVIPAVSAAIVKLHWDTYITGLITLGLSTLTGFLTELSSAGSNFNWKAAALTSLGSWAVAALSQSKILSGTQLESSLLAFRSNTATTGPGEPDPTAGLDPNEQPPVAQSVATQPVATQPVAQPAPPAASAPEAPSTTLPPTDFSVVEAGA